jgi:hypothetical protein
MKGGFIDGNKGLPSVGLSVNAGKGFRLTLPIISAFSIDAFAHAVSLDAA